MFAPFNGLKRFVARLNQFLTPARKQKSRPLVHRARLGLEFLETRELLSATVPGFTLDNSGNLYNTRGAKPQLIDTGVQNFAVVNSKVYDLRTNGVMEAMNPDGSGKMSVDTGVLKMQVNPLTGAIYSLDSAGNLDINGVLAWGGSSNPQKDFDFAPDGSLWKLNAGGELDRQNQQTGAWTAEDQGVIKLQVNPLTGAIYSLDSAGNLDINGVLGWSNTKDFALGADGSLYKLDTGGGLYHNGGQVDPGYVTKFVLASNGAVWSLTAAGNLDVNGVLGWSNTKDFAFGVDGSLYKLDLGGQLYHLGLNNVWDAKPVDAGIVTKFAMRNDGAVWSLTTASNLDVNGVLGWSNTKDFAFGVDGSLYKLDLGGQLYHLGLNNVWDAKPVDAGVVTKFAMRNDGAVWSLTTAGNLNINGQLGWSNTKDFAFGVDGSLYKLDLGGQLYHLGLNNVWDAKPVDAGVVTKFAMRNDGAVWSLTTAGNLNINGQLGWSNTKDFAFGVDGSLYKLDLGGQLYHLGLNNVWDAKPVDAGVVTKFAMRNDGAVWSLTTASNLDVNGVLGWSNTKEFAFGVDDSLYKLDLGGQLYHLGLNNVWDSKPVDAGTVTKFAIRSDGTVWSLTTAGNLDINGVMAWGGSSNPQKDFDFAPDGSLWKLNASGGLGRQNPQTGAWTAEDQGVIKLQVNPLTGAIYSLDSAGNLDINGVLAWGGSSNPQKDFDFAPDGSLWKLNASGGLGRQNPQTGAWTAEDQGVIKLQVNPLTGAIYSLDSAGNLDINGVLAWGGSSNPQKDFDFAPDGSLWKLNASGGLGRQNPQTGAWTAEDQGVIKLQVNPLTGAIYSLDSAGNLDINGVLAWGGSSNPQKDFDFAPDGSLWKLNASGGLGRQNPQTGAWTAEDQGVIKLQVNPLTGAIYSLDSAGNLDINGARVSPNVASITSSVYSFAFGTDGTLYVMNTSQGIYRQTATSWQPVNNPMSDTVAVGLALSWFHQDILDPTQNLQNSDYPAIGLVSWGNKFGTGTLIAPQWVLTAAHVVASATGPITFTAGGYGGATYQGTVFIPSEYTFTENPDYTDVGDIALIKLSTPVTGVTPLPIWTGSLNAGISVTLVGFGNTGNGFSGEQQDTGYIFKREGQTVLPDQLWRPSLNGINGWQANWLYFQYQQGYSGTGHGDSGGPDLITVGGQQYIIGVTSFATGAYATNIYGTMDFSTSVVFWAKWINYVKTNSALPPFQVGRPPL